MTSLARPLLLLTWTMVAGRGAPLFAETEGKQPLADLKGTDFAGGAHAKFGSTQYGRRHVNYDYAKPTGDFA